MSDITQLLAPMPSRLPDTFTSEWLQSPKGVPVLYTIKSNKWTAASRQADLDAIYNQAQELKTKYWDMVSQAKSDKVHGRLGHVSHYIGWIPHVKSLDALQEAVQWKVQCGDTSQLSLGQRLRCYFKQPSADFRSEAQEMLLVWHRHMSTDMPGRLAFARQKVELLSTRSITPVLNISASLLETVASSTNNRNITADKDLVRLLLFVRGVYAHALLLDAAVCASIATLDAGDAFAEALEKHFTLRALDELAPLLPYSTATKANVTLGDISSMVQQSPVQVLHTIDRQRILQLHNQWVDGLERLAKETHRMISATGRKWALDSFEHCLAVRIDKHDNSTRIDAGPSVWKQDQKTLGCASHPLPLLRWWFTEWPEGANVDTWAPQWPGVLDDRRMKKPRELKETECWKLGDVVGDRLSPAKKPVFCIPFPPKCGFHRTKRNKDTHEHERSPSSTASSTDTVIRQLSDKPYTA